MTDANSYCGNYHRDTPSRQRPVAWPPNQRHVRRRQCFDRPFRIRYFALPMPGTMPQPPPQGQRSAAGTYVVVTTPTGVATPSVQPSLSYPTIGYLQLYASFCLAIGDAMPSTPPRYCRSASLDNLAITGAAEQRHGTYLLSVVDNNGCGSTPTSPVPAEPYGTTLPSAARPTPSVRRLQRGHHPNREHRRLSF